MSGLLRLLCVGTLGLGFAAPAGADLVVFQTGRTMSVASHREEGSSIVLVLKGGGEIVCDRAYVVSVVTDNRPETQSRSLADVIDDASARHGVDAALVHAVIQVESAYRPEARSSKGAMGLMQLMPATARHYSVTDAYDPRANVEAGVRHLRSLLDRFELSLALAAYNAGEGAVRRFKGIPPYPETRAYVSRILQLFRPTAR